MDESQKQINEQEWQNEENWGYGMIYFSKKDTRTWVPKKMKWAGWTLNMATKGAFVWIIIISLFLALFPVLLVVSIMSSSITNL